MTGDPDWVDAVRDLIGGPTVGAAVDPIGGAISADLLIGDLSDAIRHATQLGKTGTVLVRP
jgi:hypothetical protein